MRSIEYLFDYLCWGGLSEVVGAVGAVEESHHPVPVRDRVLLLEKFAPQVLLPVL
jgi:hypothetical protein